MLLNVNNPATFYIKFSNPPRYFCFRNKTNNRLYYFRHLDGRTPRIKLNIPDVGVYESNHPFEVIKKVPIEIPKKDIVLPPAERDRWHTYPEYVTNNNLTGTPARCYSEVGIIEFSPEYYNFPKPIREFIRLHEIGHFFYETEEKCDLYALVNYLRLGYNRSMAYYALVSILKRTPDNMKRIDELINNIKQTEK